MPYLVVVLKLFRDLPEVISNELRNNRRFRYSYLDHLKNKIKNGFVVLGSGPTVNELTEAQFDNIANKVSIATGRWIWHDFVPDIYIIESGRSEPMQRWLKDFSKKLTEKEVEYRNTIIFIDGVKGDQALQSLIEVSIPDSLKNNLFFTQVLKPPSGSSVLFAAFLKFLKVIPIHTLLGLTVHCRSSTVLCALIGYYIGAEKITLVGVDGYAGYFVDQSIQGFHGDYGGLDKNYTKPLHSTANPEYGVPTVTDCCIVISEVCTPCLISSKNALLSQYLEIDDLS